MLDGRPREKITYFVQSGSCRLCGDADAQKQGNCNADMTTIKNDAPTKVPDWVRSIHDVLAKNAPPAIHVEELKARLARFITLIDEGDAILMGMPDAQLEIMSTLRNTEEKRAEAIEAAKSAVFESLAQSRQKAPQQADQINAST
jgi:hypothetical protein